MSRKPLDLTGMKQLDGDLTALRRLGKYDDAYLWECQCICGNKRVMTRTTFKIGRITACVECTKKKDPRHVAAEKRRAEILEMRASGMTLTDIAREQGVTKQAIQQVAARD